jgi:hypothetical protein
MHLDSTGGLVFIPQSIRNYSRINNYFLLLKDLRSFTSSAGSEKSVLVSELSSSKQNVYAISSCLRFLKNEYESKFKTRLFFRIMVIDYKIWILFQDGLTAQ